MIKAEELPDGAVVLSMERHGAAVRGILFDVDGETGAWSVTNIVECNNAADVAAAVEEQLGMVGGIWLPCWEGELVRYLQPDELSLAEAAEVALDIPPLRSDPPPLGGQALIDRIKAALGTEENGEALVAVAREAHRAEQELARQQREKAQ